MKFVILFLFAISLGFAQRAVKSDYPLPSSENNSIAKNIQLSHKYIGVTKAGISGVYRKVLLEEGTNTSCSYCAQYNPGVKQFMYAHPDSLVSVTYHVYWPGANDPMYLSNTTQVAQRINYLGMNAVPRVDIDGVHKDIYPPLPSSLTPLFNQRASTLSPVDISIFDEYIGKDSIKTVVTVDVLEELPAGNYKLRVYALDRKIIYNYPPGNNGEKEFEFVFRRGFPNMTGTSLETAIGTHDYTFTYAREESWASGLIYTMAFIQDDTDKEILNCDVSNLFYAPQPVNLLSPLNNGVTETSSVLLTWNESLNSSTYGLQISNDENFTDLIVNKKGLSELYYNLGELGESKMLYWRAKSYSSSDSSFFSEVRNFRTPLKRPYNLTGEGDNVKIDLSWEDYSSEETNYVVERAITQGIGILFKEIDTLAANTTSYTDHNTSKLGIYYYRVKAINDITFSNYSDSVQIDLKVGVDEIPNESLNFELKQNYPNPFNPSTTISFTIPIELNRANVKIVVYDMLGNEIETILNQVMEAGNHNISYSPANLSSGVYIYKLFTGNLQTARKFVYMK